MKKNYPDCNLANESNRDSFPKNTFPVADREKTALLLLVKSVKVAISVQELIAYEDPSTKTLVLVNDHFESIADLIEQDKRLKNRGQRVSGLL